jgi:Sigma-70 region 2
MSYSVDAALNSTSGDRAGFATTRWGLVAVAGGKGDCSSQTAKAALESLYRIYCYPVYAFIRRRGCTRHDAQDLTQDFFIHLVQKNTLERADPNRGKFRSFLLGSLEYFLAQSNEKARAQKRGGHSEFLFLDRQLLHRKGMTRDAAPSHSVH